MASSIVIGSDGCISLPAYATLAAYQYHGVKLYAGGYVTIGDADGDLLVGVLQNIPAAKEEPAHVFVQSGGICMAYAGEALATIGTLLTTDQYGHFIAAVDADVVCGKVFTTAGASGDLFMMIFETPHHAANVSVSTTGS